MTTQHEVEERRRRTAGEDARERLLSRLTVTERRLQLAWVSTAVRASALDTRAGQVRACERVMSQHQDFADQPPELARVRQAP